MKSKTYIRSSKVSIKFANKGRLAELQDFIQEYQRVIQLYVDRLWNLEKVPTLVSFKVDSWLSARALQAAGKQASGIVRGTRQKAQKRQFAIDKLQKDGKFKKARKLQATQEKLRASKPTIKTCKPELDQRFASLDFQSKTSFDGWLTLASLGKKLKIQLPIKKTKHFNKLQSQGQILKGCRLDSKSVTFMFEIQEPAPKTEGQTLGIDVGLSTTLSCSNGKVSIPNLHGHDFKTISESLNRRKKGSKGYRRAQTHRNNYINWTVNRLDLQGIKTVRLENIKNLRLGKRTSKLLNRWTYTEIFRKLESKFEELGVQVVKVNPRYTSQRCSSCGWVCKSNRKGKLFSCRKCQFELDSDLNGARNIGLELPVLTKEQQQPEANRKGFYWTFGGQESIVPDAHKPLVGNLPRV